MNTKFTYGGESNMCSLPNIEITSNTRREEESELLANTLIQLGKIASRQDADIKTAVKQYDRLVEENNHMALDLKQMREEYDKMRKSFEESSKSLRKEVDDWRDSYAKKSSEVDQLNRQVQLLNDECDEYCEKLKVLRSELRKAKRKR